MKKNFILPLMLLCTALTVTSCNDEDNKETPNITVTSISITPPQATVGVGATIALTATVIPDNATNKEVSWISNKPNIATVSDKGLVTGKAVGTATITVTSLDGGGES